MLIDKFFKILLDYFNLINVEYEFLFFFKIIIYFNVVLFFFYLI